MTVPDGGNENCVEDHLVGRGGGFCIGGIAMGRCGEIVRSGGTGGNLQRRKGGPDSGGSGVGIAATGSAGRRTDGGDGGARPN